MASKPRALLAHLCFVAVFALLCVPAAAQEYTGEELRSDLKLSNRVQAAGSSGSTSEFLAAGHLMGYLEGFSDAYLFERVRGGRAAQDKYAFCLPKEYKLNELRQTLEVYMGRHTDPLYDRAPAPALLAMALHEAYPCSRRP